MNRGELLVVAGEASGDLHGARLLTELAKLDPHLRAFGLGGDELRRVGLDALGHSREISVVGIAEALKILPRARRLFKTLLEETDRRRPRAALLIDFPDFNLRLARQLKRRGVPVLYYISPQVWAWRRRRARTIGGLVEKMLVLFPFEVDFYRRHGVRVVHVGHPLVDEVPERRQIWEDGVPRESPFRLSLLPGSRAAEVQALLPRMLAAVELLMRELAVQVQLIRTPAVAEEVFEEILALSGTQVSVVTKDRFQAIADSHLALCASGTATLEVGLLGTPLLVLYRVRWATALLAHLLVSVPHVSLVNLVLGRRVVPELLQRQARPKEIAREALGLLESPPAVARMQGALGELRPLLGAAGASRRAAHEVAASLQAMGA